MLCEPIDGEHKQIRIYINNNKVFVDKLNSDIDVSSLQACEKIKYICSVAATAAVQLFWRPAVAGVQQRHARMHGMLNIVKGI
jgi:hypothetical protein